MLKATMDDQHNNVSVPGKQPTDDSNASADIKVSPTTSTSSVHVKHAHKFLFGYLVLLVFAAALAGVYNWQHNKVNTLSNQVASLKTSVPKSNNKSSQNTVVSSPSPVTEIDTLPNGTKVSYPLTVGNANVVWWSDGNDTPSSSKIAPDGYMTVSDKHVIQFLSTLPTDVIQNLCPNGWDNETGFQMGIYDTTNKTLSLHNQYENCIDAASADTGSKYAAQAQQVLTTATADLNSWADSLTISTQ